LIQLRYDESETEDSFSKWSIEEEVFKLLDLIFCAKDKPDPWLTDELLDSLGY